MTTRVYLIRHGATELSSEDRFSGGTEVDLSDVGKDQVAALADRLAGDHLTSIYCSPMRRTMETATVIGEPHQITPIPREELREMNHGHWETMSRRDVEAKFPDEYHAWEEDPLTFAPEGGESGLLVMARALPVIREIVTRHANQTVAIVSHKATIRLILSSLLGFDARGYRDRLDQSPACLNIVDFKDPSKARLMLFNDVSHYVDRPAYPGRHLSSWFDPQSKPSK